MENIYVVKVFTSNLLDAGTDANVFLEMLSTNGNTSGEKIFLFYEHDKKERNCFYSKHRTY